MKYGALAVLLLLGACGAKEEIRDCCAKIEPPHQLPSTGERPPAQAPFDLSQVAKNETPACIGALTQQYHLTDPELWVMLHAPDYVCSNLGVTDARIREIAGFWEAAGCRMRTPKQLLEQLDSGACGGDAG